MAERFAQVSPDIDLCYETFGSPDAAPLLLVMGLGTQMIAWREDFCEQLVERGFYVIRFDNRDNGRSSRVDGPPPSVRQLVTADRRAAHYTLSDMAADAVGLLDHLEIDSAHVTGASMGGMIAQTIAIDAPDRVRSLVSIMSTTGGRWVGRPALSVLPTLLRSAPRDREAFADHVVALYGKIGSPGYTANVDEIRSSALRAFDRGITAAGTGRQLAAVIAADDRSARLRDIKVPTLVLHGDKDRMVHPSGARATARAIPDAELRLIAGMGHDLPREVWPEIVDGIVATAARAGERLEGRPADRSAA